MSSSQKLQGRKIPPTFLKAEGNFLNSFFFLFKGDCESDVEVSRVNPNSVRTNYGDVWQETVNAAVSVNIYHTKDDLRCSVFKLLQLLKLLEKK